MTDGLACKGRRRNTRAKSPKAPGSIISSNKTYLRQNSSRTTAECFQMSSATSPSSLGSRTAAVHHSCVLCKSRKIRCNRAQPCSACVRAGTECVPGTRSPYTRRKPRVAASPSNTARSSSLAPATTSPGDRQHGTKSTATFGQ
jgi:hypothetical protein